MISVKIEGNTRKTEAFLDRMIYGDIYKGLESLAQAGVDALSAATPKDSGLTAQSWTYEISRSGNNTAIWWLNHNSVNGFNVAIGLQYGHGTGTGGWVQGYDYINPTLRPVFDDIANSVWREVQNA